MQPAIFSQQLTFCLTDCQIWQHLSKGPLIGAETNNLCQFCVTTDSCLLPPGRETDNPSTTNSNSPAEDNSISCRLLRQFPSNSRCSASLTSIFPDVTPTCSSQFHLVCLLYTLYLYPPGRVPNIDFTTFCVKF